MGVARTRRMFVLEDVTEVSKIELYCKVGSHDDIGIGRPR